MRRCSPYALAALCLTALAGELLFASQTPVQSQTPGRPTSLTTPNPSGAARSVFLNGATFDLRNPFFKNIGTNGRACASCHVPADGWTITPAHILARFNATKGMDPIFSAFDGTNSPNADLSTLAARRAASSMLLNKGLIRIGIAIPDNAEFTLDAVDDPYGYASATDLSLFRRPLPTTNLRFLTGVMWDGRESTLLTQTMPISAKLSDADNLANLTADLLHQANSATTGHARATRNLTAEEAQATVDFETSIATAQLVDKNAGALTSDGATGGPASIATDPFYVTINDVLGGDHFGIAFDSSSMTLFDAWKNSSHSNRAQIARGAVLFNTKVINITDVKGINDDLNVATLKGTCTTCHDSPNIGNHSVALALDIGLTDASRRTADMPLYTLKNKVTGDTIQTIDPGRALISGKWKDIGRFKGPVLRGLAARAPYFHNGFAADLEAAVTFYDTRFDIDFTDQEKADLVAFLKTL